MIYQYVLNFMKIKQKLESEVRGVISNLQLVSLILAVSSIIISLVNLYLSKK
jgi:hypothetical protein